MGQGSCPIFFESMKETTRKYLFILVVVLLALDFYAIFNAGNPRSLFRFIVPDPRYDYIITLVLSIAAVALALVLTAERTGRLKSLLDMNRDFIQELRGKGRSDGEIAESFLNELKAPAGLLRSLARARVMRYLSKLK
ncbi:MAG: hypothetical protein A2V99_05780 [Spirochaetes bacterium RBG_16_67_19]|nr:MAG: hypothetical protein A2V99_05780 [Spirochaetes bacterium RBG_16_67_19]